MKKAIKIFLMLSMVLSVVFASPIRTFAAETGDTILVMQGREQTVYNEMEIDVFVKENSGVSSMLLSLEYDTSVFTLIDLEYGPAFSSLSPIHTNTATEQGYGIYPFMISYLGDANDTSTGRMMTLRFRIKDDAPDGSYHVNLTYERDKAVSYLKDGKILTKNLLINGAEVTLTPDRFLLIETHTGKTTLDSKQIALWIVGVIGAAAVIVGCVVFVSVSKKRKKWTKI